MLYTVVHSGIIERYRDTWLSSQWSQTITYWVSSWIPKNKAYHKKRKYKNKLMTGVEEGIIAEVS